MAAPLRSLSQERDSLLQNGVQMPLWIPLAIDHPPSSLRVALQDGWASAVSAC